MSIPELKLELVHVDKRGEIYSITLPGDRELMLHHSVPGSLRGGHCHDVHEVVMLLTGRMRYYKRTPSGKEWTQELEAGDMSYNPAGDYHMGEFLEDSYLLEWKLNTTKTGWRNVDYEPYRSRVRANANGL